MSRNVPDLPWAVHLSDQLKTLSELMETLTFKMLELEERCAAQEEQLAALHHGTEQHDTELAQAMDSRIQETEQRLGRIEMLLRPEQHAPAPPPLRALARPTPIGKKGRESTQAPSEEREQLDPPHHDTSFEDQFLEEIDGDEPSLAS
ncbi:MAG: hypothetical protein ACK59A_14200 [Cyanobacteriota bacterium]|jgi:hypothetical protein